MATTKSVQSDVRVFMVKWPSLDKNEFLKKEGPKKMTTYFFGAKLGVLVGKSPSVQMGWLAGA